MKSLNADLSGFTKWGAKDPLLNTNKKLDSSFTIQCGRVRDIQKPYTELFADFIMAIAVSDQSAPFEAYHTPSVPASDILRFKLGSFSEKSDGSSCVNSDEHTFFTSVRYRIGQKFLKTPNTNADKKVSILQFYKIISNDLLAYWKKDQTLPDCKTANKNLSDRLN